MVRNAMPKMNNQFVFKDCAKVERIPNIMPSGQAENRPKITVYNQLVIVRASKGK